MQQFRDRLSDGTLGPLTPAFPGNVQLDQTTLLLLEAVAGQQEEIDKLKADLNALKGGNK